MGHRDWYLHAISSRGEYTEVLALLSDGHQLDFGDSDVHLLPQNKQDRQEPSRDRRIPATDQQGPGAAVPKPCPGLELHPYHILPLLTFHHIYLTDGHLWSAATIPDGPDECDHPACLAILLRGIRARKSCEKMDCDPSVVCRRHPRRDRFPIHGDHLDRLGLLGQSQTSEIGLVLLGWSESFRPGPTLVVLYALRYLLPDHDDDGSRIQTETLEGIDGDQVR